MSKTLKNMTKAELLQEVENLNERISNSKLFQGSHVVEKYEKALSKSEEKYRTYFKASSNLTVVICNGKIIEANGKFLNFFSLKEVEVLKQKPETFFPKIQPDGSDSLKKLGIKIRQILHGKLLSFYWKIIINERFYDVECTVNYLKLDGKKYFQIFLQEINELNNSELQLIKIRNSYNYLINFVPDGILIHKGGNIITANPTALKILEYNTVESIVGESLFKMLQPEFVKTAKIRLKTLNSGLNVPFFTYKIIAHKTRIVKDVDVQSFPLVSFNNGEIFMILRERVESQNIEQQLQRADETEFTNRMLQNEIIDRIRIQGQLQNTQYYLSNIINSSLDIIIASDNDGNITEFNKAAQRTFGFSRNEVMGKSTAMLYGNADMHKKVQTVLKDNGQYSDEIVNKKKDGTLFLSYLNLSEMNNEVGEYIGRVGISRDITDVKNQQVALKLSEEKYREIFENTSDLLFSCKPDGKFIYYNSSFLNNLEYTNEELETQGFLEILHPNNLQNFINIIHNDATKTLIRNLELTLIKSNKKYIVASGSIDKKYVDGNLHSLICSFKNVSDLKLAEENVRLSEDRYKAVFNQEFLGIVITGLFGEVIQFNTKFLHVFGLENKNIIGKKLADILPDGNQITAQSNNLLINNISKFNLEIKFKHHKQTVVCNESIELVKDAFGNPDYFLYLFDDISEKKAAEDKVITQSAKLNALLQSSSQLIFTMDRALRLSSYNEQFKTLFKNTFDFEPEINFRFAKFAKTLLPTNDFNAYSKLHTSALKGHPQHIEKKFTTATGEVIWFETYIDPIVLPDGSIDEVSYINHNITEKKISQDKISQSLVEKEVLLKEVHHRVKNNLQVISSILNLQSSYLKDQQVIETVKDIQNRIKSMALIHENLYQNSDLSKLNFRDYILQLTQNLIHSHQIYDGSINLKVDIQDIYLNLDYSIPCGLIINELVSNTFKHAFPKGLKGDVIIKIVRLAENICLTISDTGAGFKKGINFRETESLGLQLVMALVDQISGTIELSSVPGNTVYEIKFKYKPN